jgi:conjugative relaxase-like TrwC/TraI family protein
MPPELPSRSRIRRSWLIAIIFDASHISSLYLFPAARMLPFPVPRHPILGGACCILLAIVGCYWKAFVVHGGVKVYRGAPAAARNYVEADRSRADDYYLAEGIGIAEHLTPDPEGRVVELDPLSGDGYEAWVAGVNPDTGEACGRLRTDGHAVRFVEVVVNGPKSWSLAAELHPDVAAAYEAAQERAARQVVGWLGRHATTRVGPRGGQVAVPVEKLDIAVVRHYTSRAGDPHRHLHLQVSARVFAAGKWRGLDTVAFRDSIQAINGTGHAAVVCDPEFRSVLAVHGYTLTGDGEITQLAKFIGPFSKRAAQIGAHLERYEADWRREHPREEPGPRLRRAWDARAWAEDRPDKVIPRDGSAVHARWLDELHALGYRDRDMPVQLALPLPGGIDRDAAVVNVIARLGAGRSAWNTADVRGEVEQLLARGGVLAEPGIRVELAEDLTARALALCLALRDDTPEHIRALTSRHVLDVEADLVARLAGRGARAVSATRSIAADGLDAGQRAAVIALAGDAPLVVVEGAAGAGKTTTLAAVRAALDAQRRRLVVVTPTRKAAQVAAAEIGAHAGSAAWLAYQHGWRWDETGTWTRLTPGDVDPATGRSYDGPNEAARLRAGDSLLVDEAGMLDQDTARALLTIADETGARVALVGDRRQLPAVGRGGVLELACRWTHPDAHVDLTDVHRFVHVVDQDTVPDEQYAALSLAMRTGDDPGAVFDALHARGLIALHGSDTERTTDLAERVAADRIDGATPTVVLDTREQATVVNTAIRDRLVHAGAVDNERTTRTGDGQPIGAGDLIVTRRNDTGLGIANRETWTVTGVHRDGRLTITAPGRGKRELPADYMREHVELGYAVTGYGAQGDTTEVAHLILTDNTTAASAYVAMTRGRHTNTAHLVAADLDDARDQWIAAFGRDRADHGPEHARRQAERAAAGYLALQPTGAEQLTAALDRLRAAWTTQAAAHSELERAQQKLAAAQSQARWWDHCRAILDPLRERQAAAAEAAQQAAEMAHASTSSLAAATQQHEDALRRAWSDDLVDAHAAACTVAAGTGRLGLHRTRVRDAQAVVDAWTHRWQTVLEETRIDQAQLQRLPTVWFSTNIDTVRAALHRQAEQRAGTEHPDHPALLAAAETAEQHSAAARSEYYNAREQLSRRHPIPYRDPAAALDGLTAEANAAHQQAIHGDEQVARLSADPAITGQPDPRRLLATTRQRWQHDHDAREAQERRTKPHRPIPPTPVTYHSPTPARGPEIGI